MLVISALDDTSIDDAAGVVAAQHAAARDDCPALPAEALDISHCAEALAQLLIEGSLGVIARRHGRCVGVLCGRAIASHAILPASGVAIDPTVADDATAVLVRLYAELSPPLLAAGATDHYGTHINWSPLSEAFTDTGFGRTSIYATQRARPATDDPGTDVRIGTGDDLAVIAALSHIEMMERFVPPVYSPPHPREIDDVRSHHRQLLAAGAVHLLARVDGADVGLLTLERTSPAPRLCPAGQPYIGPTATLPSARGRGVGTSLVRAALDWAFRHDCKSVSVDFQPTNPLSRPFWRGAGFSPTGYGVARSIDSFYATERPRVDS